MYQQPEHMRIPCEVGLSDRLKKQDAGSAGDPHAAAARLIRAYNIPLSDWFAAHPERLERLNRVDRYYMGCVTLGQAAAHLYNWVVARGGAPNEQDKAVLWALFSPLVDWDQSYIRKEGWYWA